jgi:hypothetical protein
MGIRSRVGAIFNSIGSASDLRSGQNGDLIVAQGKGDFSEASERGQVFMASTGAAGVAPGTALGTAPPIAIWNPSGSGVLVSILRIRIGYVSGTLGAGEIVWARNAQTAAPTGGTELTTVCARVGNNAGNARAFQGSTISATATIMRPTGISMGAALASSVDFPNFAGEDIDGCIAVPENQLVCLQGIAAAGTSPLLCFGVVWQEIPTS